MLKKDGIDVKALGGEIVENTQDKTPEQIPKSKKTGLVESLEFLLNIGNINTEAKGLNNSKNSLLLYSSQNNYLSFTGDTNNNWQQLRVRGTNGSYDLNGTQRFCFDNDNNKIYITTEGMCNGWWNKKCIHALGGPSYGGTVGLYDCNFQSGNDSNQKWFFDEENRLAMMSRPDMCIESSWGLGNGNGLVTWGCSVGAGLQNQSYRAGYNNFGTGMGMSIWATGIGSESSPFFDGHAYIELWNSFGGLHNTFGKWDAKNYDNNCSRSQFYNINYTKNNNICDYDAINVDNEWEWKHYINPIIDNKNYYKKGTWSSLSKNDWDYIAFGSGYRSNNKYDGNWINLGSDGTYAWGYSSRSRDANYRAEYRIIGNNTYCSSYAYTFWQKFRNGNSKNLSLSGNGIITPTDIYNQL